MLKKEVNKIKELILVNNPYFQNGFTNVYQNTDYGVVLKEDDTSVFPAAELGDCFYLRLPNNVQFVNANEYAIADSIKGTGLSAQIILVACVTNADEDILLQNIVNSLQHTCSQNIVFNNAIFNKNDVISQELAFMTEEQRSKAKANIPDNYTLVSLSFTLSFSFTFNKCITNPCSC